MWPGDERVTLRKWVWPGDEATLKVVSFPDPTLSRGKGSGVYRPLSWAFRLYESGDFLQ